MNAGGIPVAWFYEIRDSNNAVMETGKGFATHQAAMAAGRKRAR
jgi:ribosomal protein S12 methylthiotransferase accessory factor YcaO